MSTFKELAERNITTTKIEVNSSSNYEVKLATAQEGLFNAIIYYRFIQTYGEQARYQVHLEQYNSEYQYAQSDKELRSSIKKLTDTEQILKYVEEPGLFLESANLSKALQTPPPAPRNLENPYMDLTDKQLLSAELQAKESIINHQHSLKELESFGEYAKPLLDELAALPENKKHSQAYLNFYAELENLQKFGTTEFKYSGPIDDPTKGSYAEKGKEVSVFLANRAIDRLKKYVHEYCIENLEFKDKADALIWGQQKRFEGALNEPDPLDIDKINKAKRLRDIENSTIDLKKAYDSKMSSFNRDLIKSKMKYEKNKLHLRGSREYDEIGEELDELERRFELCNELDVSSDNKNTIEYQRLIKQNAKAVIEQIEKLKKKTDAYYQHKQQDGQWKDGVNKNAKKRIAAVDNISQMADQLRKVMDVKLLMAENIIRTHLEENVINCGYDDWCELFPKALNEYKKDEVVPDGLRQLDKKVGSLVGIAGYMDKLGEEMGRLGHTDEWNEFSPLAADLKMCFSPKDKLEHPEDEKYRIKPEDWYDKAWGAVDKIAAYLNDKDKFCHLMEAADAIDAKSGKKDHSARNSILDSANAISTMMGRDIKLDELRAEYKLRSQKKALEEKALETLMHHVYTQELAQSLKESLKDTAPKDREEYKKAFIAENTFEKYKKAQGYNEAKEELRGKELFKSFMESIKDNKALEHAGAMAKSHDSQKLFDYIRFEKFKPLDLDKQINIARVKLEDAYSKLGGNYPDGESCKAEYAQIITALKMKKNKNPDIRLDTYNGENFETLAKGTENQGNFKSLLKNNTPEKLYKLAFEGNGNGLLIEEAKLSNDLEQNTTPKPQPARDLNKPVISGPKPN